MAYRLPHHPDIAISGQRELERNLLAFRNLTFAVRRDQA